MIFIDGSWLYKGQQILANEYGKESFKIDYGKLPQVLAQIIAEQMGTKEIDVVRTYIFGSIPSNYDSVDFEIADAQSDFYDTLSEEYHYETVTYPVDFRGHRIPREERGDFTPQEKCVDVAFATQMLYFAAIPYAYDIGVAVAGDRDYIPVFQHVRRLGRRVAIASIRGSCPKEFAESEDPKRVRDFDVIWLNDIIDKIELRYERHKAICQDPLHEGSREFYTDYRPRKGEKIYCPKCRERFRKNRGKHMTESVGESDYVNPADYPTPGTKATATIHYLDEDHCYAESPDYLPYIFWPKSLADDVEWNDLNEGMKVQFKVMSCPAKVKACPVEAVRPAE